MKKVGIKTEFIENNGVVTVNKVTEGHRKSKVPVGIYAVKQDQRTGEFFLVKEKDSYKIGKIYGKLQQTRAKRIQKAYSTTDSSLGVLLSGLKGTGKTVLLKLIANRMVKKGLPVISISTAYIGDDFNSFIESLGKCVIMFDEFTKTYNTKEAQAKLLTLFDGLNSTKRLTILTSNEPRQLNQFFFDRPGRILYHYDFSNLDEETFYGFLNDNLKSKLFRKDIIKTYRTSFMYTFDILKTLVHECNTNEEMKFSTIVAPLNISELRTETYVRVLEVQHEDSGKIFKEDDFGENLFLPKQSINIYNLISSKVRIKKSNQPIDFYYEMYLEKDYYLGSIKGIKTFSQDGWKIKVKEVTK